MTPLMAQKNPACRSGFLSAASQAAKDIS